MARDDIQNSQDVIDTQVVGQENTDAPEIEDGSADSETRTFVFLDGQYTGRLNELLVNKVETTSTEEDSLRETTEIRLKTASGCGHVLHTGSEAGVACLSCGRLGQKEPLILCAECAKDSENICYICNAASCYRCRRERRFLDGEMRVVCKACVKSTLRIKLFKQLLKWLLIAGGIYYLLKF